MGATKKRILKSLREGQFHRGMGASQGERVSARGNEVSIHGRGQILSQGDKYVSRDARTGTIGSSLSGVVGGSYVERTAGSISQLSAKKFVGVVSSSPAPQQRVAKQVQEEYVDPILFEMGVFSDKEEYAAATDAFVARIKSGELQPRPAEEETED